MPTLVILIDWAFRLYSVAIVLRALLPWVGVSHFHPVMRFLIQITEPVMAPLRRFVRPVNGLDFTPMIALIIVYVIRLVLLNLLQALATLIL